MATPRHDGSRPAPDELGSPGDAPARRAARRRGPAARSTSGGAHRQQRLPGLSPVRRVLARFHPGRADRPSAPNTDR